MAKTNPGSKTSTVEDRKIGEPDLGVVHVASRGNIKKLEYRSRDGYTLDDIQLSRDPQHTGAPWGIRFGNERLIGISRAEGQVFEILIDEIKRLRELVGE